MREVNLSERSNRPSAMANQDWEVKLINKGRTMVVVVPAYTQREARETAERFYPDYKAMSAKRL